MNSLSRTPNWSGCRKILIVRLDNLGDILMSSPAIAALKESFGCEITMLTSSAGAPICRFIPAIDDVIIFDAPWLPSPSADADSIEKTIAAIRKRSFDAAVIFTVCSQSALPAALMLYEAQVPRRLAYSRENPYHLLTDWVPDEEPYSLIRHQVERDLHLVQSVGATTIDERLRLTAPRDLWQGVRRHLESAGLRTNSPWLIFHPGVSEQKREYQIKDWIELAKVLTKEGFTIVLTGTTSQFNLLKTISQEVGRNVIVCETKSLDEFITLINHAPLVVTVNTVTSHVAAAVRTPVIVLYAETNPQHTPWRVVSRIFTFPVPLPLRSRNQVVRHLSENFRIEGSSPVNTADIAFAVAEMYSLSWKKDSIFQGAVPPVI